MTILQDPNLWLYVLVGLFGLSLIVPVITVIRSRRLAGGTAADSQGGLPVSDIVDNPRVLLPHLLELRRRLTWSVIALVIGVAVSFIFSQQLLNILAEPIGGLDQLEAIEVTEPLTVFMRVALLSGFILALPFIFAQVWLFIAPGLRENEFRYIYYILPAAIFLFLAGAAFAYFVMLPVAIPFLIGFMDIPTAPRPANYFKFVTSLPFWVGIAFESPLVVLVLARMGLVTPQVLLRGWRFAIVIIAVVAAVVTPTIDPLNMGLVMAPLFVLYLLSILLAKLAYRPRQESSSTAD